MGTRHLARLQFRADSPAVEGDWTVPDTGRDRYTEWVGLYGTDPHVVIRLIEETDGIERVLRTWTSQGPSAPTTDRESTPGSTMPEPRARSAWNCLPPPAARERAQRSVRADA